jgi:diguanylate cyclase (GGDEF)-like protein
VTDLLRHPDLPLAPEGAPTGRSALSGTFAASMERVARLAALTLPAPAALLALFGDDRRCFHAGSLRRAWFAHDSGVLVRSGLLQRTIDSGGTLVLRNALDSEDDWALRDMAGELNLVGVAATTFAGDDGTVLGLLCAIDDVPREWTDRDLQLLTELAQVAASELQLRFHIGERELREHRLRHDSLHDSLTGLPNRTLFMKRLSDATQRARRGEDGLFAVLFLDLDGFKLVNDSMGHHVGDEMLVTVARRLEHCVRPGDIVARLGGDEFAILLERITNARDSTSVAERVHRALSVPINIGGYEHVTSASIGVALSTGPNELPEYILRGADIAMYRAKHGGRGRCEMFDRAMHAEALTRLQIESDLRHAFERQEFFLQYQPIVALRDGRIAGVEALVRWQHPERGVIAPATFVPVAEDTGLVIPLGRWVLREACQQARAWQERYERDRPFSVSVNLSVREFGQKDLGQTLATILEETGLPPSRLKLEITESAIIGQKHPAIEMVEELRALGVGIHLDDFGTGYSALNYLHRLPLDAVKVDRAFTSAIDAEERPLHVVRAIVTLAHAIGMEVVAEGVMSQNQLELLRAMKCDLAQGFLFARPGSAEEIEALLARDARW